MSNLSNWLNERGITRVECLIPDLSGTARGKRVSSDSLTTGSELRFPLVGLVQSISGDCQQQLVPATDPDMRLIADLASLRPLPWASEPTAQLIHDCHAEDGTPVPQAPRNVLKRVLAHYQALGLQPIVAPEMEFYLTAAAADPCQPPGAPSGRHGQRETRRRPYSIDAADTFSAVLDDIYRYCHEQGIGAAAVLHEVGRGQLEINLDHGDALALADQVFLFKRTVHEAARQHGLIATFMAKPMADDAGSAMHIHQSLIHLQTGLNAFSLPDGKPAPCFFHYIGGLQHYLPDAMLLFAPYVNSFRRLAPFSAAPINVAWGYDNRTCGLRIPHSPPAARRVENRLPGVDANPYLALAATLACGLLGIRQEIKPDAALQGSAYGLPYAFPRTLGNAITALENSEDLAEILGAEFVASYCALKKVEDEEFNRIVTPWELQNLLEYV
ncbi:glutamine synthetase family protein [Craterilacuibacter sp.]|uniref:glutamine synthetase family protein n=1 Tax=Craterilacuibacter sp. TaxID=2870909 RepID=UPI003F395378